MVTLGKQKCDWPIDAGYTPSEHGVGIVHLGIGAFHRAHQAVYTDDALAKSGGDWRTVGVSLRSREIVDALNAQDGKYHLVVRTEDADKPDVRVIGSVAGALSAQDGVEDILAALTRPETRIVSLTITEKGYEVVRSTGEIDIASAAISADLAKPETPKTAIGLIVRALDLRRQAGTGAFTVLSCDNLPENGKLTRAAVESFARHIAPELARWISQNVRFPSAMVDRITPAGIDVLRSEIKKITGEVDLVPVETEPFSQWVVEDDFCAGRPDWHLVGALMVEDVAPYEKMKLRMLNGAHSMLAYAGFINGKTYVRDVMQDANMAELVAKHIAAAARTLDPLPEINLSDYAHDLAERFSNPNIAHETYQIAMDGSQKLPQRIFEPALVAISRKNSTTSFAFATAAWIRYLLGKHDNGDAYALRDPREGEFSDLPKTCGGDAVAWVNAIFQLPDLVPTALADNATFKREVQKYLARMIDVGMPRAITEFLEDNH